MPRLRILHRALVALASLVAVCAIAGEGEWQVPSVLQPWKDAAYTKRFFLEVHPPGAVGAGTMGEPETAGVILPLKPGEPLLLVGEDGAEHGVMTQPAGSDVQVVFRTRSGLRRVCLYAGAANAQARQSAPFTLEAVLPGVRMRGASAPPDFAYSEGKPLTLERFQALEKRGEGSLGRRHVINIDEPECPFFKINVNVFGYIGSIINPERYAAVYEALLRTPVTGDYKFSVDTLGVAHLLIDGKPVITVGAPDLRRDPFTLTGTLQLAEGVHRVLLYYAEANPPGQTNANLGLFGVRLHWQPPFAEDLLCVPAQAFAEHLPAMVMRMEGGNNSPHPFINLESVGQVLAGAYLGDRFACERVLLVASAVGAVPGASLRVNAPGMAEAAGAAGAPLAAWVPAGKEVKVTLVAPQNNAVLVKRTASFPVLGKTAPELLDLEGELGIKSAPDFLYLDETGHIHLEALLCPAPVIVFKERQETRLLPPPPRPLGQYRVTWCTQDAAGAAAPGTSGGYEATPLDTMRRKRRISLDAANMETQAKTGSLRLFIRLAVGGAEVDTLSARILYATSAWPGAIVAGADHLLFGAGAPDAWKNMTLEEAQKAGLLERVIMLVPKESESEYRKFRPLKAWAHEDIGKEALFLGDPLVESTTPKANADELAGVAKLLGAQVPGVTWKSVCLPGPHRHMPAFRLLAGLEACVREQPDGKLPALAVVSLGGGDVARQTPLHTFERILDVLIARLQLAGVKRIVVVGVIPEPTRERQCDAYQDRVSEVLRLHHVDSVDVLNTWIREGNWARHFTLEGTEGAPVFGPVPNAKARAQIAKMIKDRL